MTPDEELAALRRLAELEAKAGKQTAPKPTLTQKLQASVPMRIWQGMRDPIDAGAQMLPRGLAGVTSAFGVLPNPVSEYFDKEAARVDDMVAQGEQDYQAARTATGQEGFDGGRLTGNILSPANAAVAARVPMAASMTVPALAGRGAVAGAIGGASQPVTDTSEGFWGQKAAQTGVGAATGGVLSPPMVKFGDALVKGVSGALNRFRDPEVLGARASVLTDDVIRNALEETGQTLENLPNGYLAQVRQQVREALKSGKKLDAAALMRLDDFKELGVPPTLGAITRDATQFAKERNLRAVEGVGTPLLNRFGEQNRILARTLRSMGGPDAAEPYKAGDELIGVLGKLDEQLRGRVTEAYKGARDAVGRDADIPLQGLAQDYARIVRDYGDKNIPQAVARRLEEYGLMSGKQGKVFTPLEAEDLLQVINKNKSNDPAINSALGEIRAAVKKALTEGPADDVFASARSMARDRFTLHDSAPALKAVAEGDAVKDNFVQKYILNGKVDEVKVLSEVLRRSSPDAFKQARNQIAANLERAAFGENPAGDKLFTAERFAKAMRTIGSDKLEAFFSPQEIAQLNRLGRVGAYINALPDAAPVMGNPNMAWAGRLLHQVPGIPIAAALLQSGARQARNTRDVSAAVEAAVPQSAADVSPEVARFLAHALAQAGAASGSAAAIPFR